MMNSASAGQGADAGGNGRRAAGLASTTAALPLLAATAGTGTLPIRILDDIARLSHPSITRRIRSARLTRNLRLPPVPGNFATPLWQES
jgi:hypothetical protein